MRLDPAAVGLLRREVGETCGVIDGAGNCVEETEACQEPVIPVCARDGKEFTNDCERKKAKQQLDYANSATSTARPMRIFLSMLRLLRA
jgi:hypothetical protein